MSLINEALKRAKQQTAAPPKLPAPELEFKSSDNSGNPESGMSWPTPVGLAMIALLAGVLVWHYGFNTAKPETEVRARTMAPAGELAKPEPPTGVPMMEAAKAASATIAAVQQVATSNAQDVASATVATPATNAVAAVPEPPALKLQGIVYSPTRPSVMINGKTLLPGEKVQGFTVTRIGANFAVLSDGKKEVRLTLE